LTKTKTTNTKTMSQLNFDATKVNPAGDRTPVPKGKYKVVLKTTDVKNTESNKGRFIACGATILDGPVAGKMLFWNINVQHENPVATQIGQEQLSALCYAVGVLQITDTIQLHGRPFVVDVDIQKGDDRYNEIRGYFREDGSPIQATPAQAANPAPSTPPAWAQHAQPAPAPAQPAPAAAPAPAQTDNRTFFVCVNGQVLPGQPIGADAVRALGHPLASIQVCIAGEQTWQPGTILQPASPAPAPAPVPAAAPAPAQAGGAPLPPWLQNAPPAA
jgi:Protein of unknown function (DUF669)